MTQPTYRFEIRVEPRWLHRVRERASELGLASTAFVRMAVASYLELTAPSTTHGQRDTVASDQPATTADPDGDLTWTDVVTTNELRDGLPPLTLAAEREHRVCADACPPPA